MVLSDSEVSHRVSGWFQAIRTVLKPTLLGKTTSVDGRYFWNGSKQPTRFV